MRKILITLVILLQFYIPINAHAEGYNQADYYNFHREQDGTTILTFKSGDLPKDYHLIESNAVKINSDGQLRIHGSMKYFFAPPGNNGGPLAEIDASQFDTSDVTEISYLLMYNLEVKKLNLENWNTSNVTNMEGAFLGTSLEELNVDNWDTSKVTNMSGMFCQTGIKELNLSSFDFTNVINKQSMFLNSKKLKKLTLPKTFSAKNSEVGLSNIPISDVYTGFWVKENQSTMVVGTSDEFIDEFKAEEAGTYVWQKKSDLLMGDINGDGVVDLDDLVALRGYLNIGALPEGVSEKYIKQVGDINGDGAVDLDDFVALRGFLNTGSWS